MINYIIGIEQDDYYDSIPKEIIHNSLLFEFLNKLYDNEIVLEQNTIYFDGKELERTNKSVQTLCTMINHIQQNRESRIKYIDSMLNTRQCRELPRLLLDFFPEKELTLFITNPITLDGIDLYNTNNSLYISRKKTLRKITSKDYPYSYFIIKMEEYFSEKEIMNKDDFKGLFHHNDLMILSEAFTRGYLGGLERI